MPRKPHTPRNPKKRKLLPAYSSLLSNATLALLAVESVSTHAVDETDLVNSTYQRSIRLAESLESRRDNDLDLRILDLVSSHTYQIFYLT